MRTAALIALAALTLAGAWALATAHTWPEWDERATDYPEWRP